MACLQEWGSSQEQLPPQVLDDDLESFINVSKLYLNPLNNLGSTSISEKYETSSIVSIFSKQNQSKKNQLIWIYGL